MKPVSLSKLVIAAGMIALSSYAHSVWPTNSTIETLQGGTMETPDTMDVFNGKTEIIKPEKSANSDFIFHCCPEQKPEFPGGDSAMMRFITQNMKYPEQQLKDGIQGRVIVKFKVDSLGQVCDPTVMRGIEPALDKEAFRLVKSFPKFSPGKLNGKKVNVWMSVSIPFQLPE